MALAIFDLDFHLMQPAAQKWWQQCLHLSSGMPCQWQWQDTARLQGVPYAFLNQLAQVFSQGLCQHEDLYAVQKLQQEHLAVGHQTLLISNYHHGIIQALAQSLQVGAWLSPQLETINGICTGKLLRSNSDDKKQLLQHQLWDEDLELHGSWCYSASEDAIALLEHVTHPVVSSLNPALVEQAEHSGWLQLHY